MERNRKDVFLRQSIFECFALRGVAPVRLAKHPSGQVVGRGEGTELRNALTGLDSEDTSIVVSGSLARDEFAKGSDIDWSLPMDGSADPKHHDFPR